MLPIAKILELKTILNVPRNTYFEDIVFAVLLFLKTFK